MSCPICHTAILRQCRCLMAHRICENGHEWHDCPVHHVLVTGPADHAHPHRCSCPDKEPDDEPEADRT